MSRVGGCRVTEARPSRPPARVHLDVGGDLGTAGSGRLPEPHGGRKRPAHRAGCPFTREKETHDENHPTNLDDE